MFYSAIDIPRQYLILINQLFEVERKLENIKEENSIDRNLKKMKAVFEADLLPEDAGLTYHNPIGESYDQTRTDVEASIAGNSTKKLKIVEVIKPIIRLNYQGETQIVQKGVVVVEGKKGWF